ncbi:MipA/OmpV family protein [Aliiglaciecola sp. LCG003]|uniref:MipA/OmpV family protein n=1 Tax=Aliiglaciecola sp. LCG003 TaxID=3053655 RepID=UPI0025729344|nr:MipA/OmpV family protein [Aliiglaciecola sp. LCG003]WJG09803.1 MipA/OmpV family protein [Aliiglaciecola sp. LCG003]
MIRTILQFLFLAIAPSSIIMAPAMADEPNNGLSWNVTVEMGLVSDPTLIKGGEQHEFADFTTVDIWLDLYYKGFFIQSNRYRSSGYIGATELGYELHLDEDYEVALINKNYVAGYNQTSVGLIDNQFNQQLAGINTRKYSPSQGIRYLRYLDNAVAWVDLSADLLTRRHKGWVIDTFYSHVIENRNWDISVGAGLTLFSQNMTDYYFGVDAAEVAVNRPYYQPSRGLRAEVEAIARYPLSASWLFTVGTTVSHYSNTIKNSPLVARQNVVRFKMSVSYVF